MSLARGIYGIEYNPGRRDEHPLGPFGWLVILVLLAAAVSLVVTLCRRKSPQAEDMAVETPPEIVQEVVEPRPQEQTPPPPPVVKVPHNVVVVNDIASRSPQVRNLLLRLEAAEQERDLALAVTTIEQIRLLPGQPAADLDDVLARRLGALNLSWLFDGKNAQWVSEVKVKAGDSATRIAQEHGSTLASLRELNPGLDLEKLRAGRDKVLVMNHPRFNLIVYVRTRTADLQLNGKFFKRYDLRDSVTGAIGSYETPANLRPFLAEKGIWFSAADRTEIEMLLPHRSSLLIAEL